MFVTGVARLESFTQASARKGYGRMHLGSLLMAAESLEAAAVIKIVLIDYIQIIPKRRRNAINP